MKGVSPVVATVLMVAITIGAAVVAYAWFMSMQSSIQAGASRCAGTVGKERISVEAVKCDNPPGDRLHIYVRNLGDERINGKFTITVKDASTDIVIYSTSKNADIPKGDRKDIIVDDIGNLNGCKVSGTDSEYVTVEVVTPGGAVDSKTERIGS